MRKTKPTFQKFCDSQNAEIGLAAAATAIGIKSENGHAPEVRPIPDSVTQALDRSTKAICDVFSEAIPTSITEEQKKAIMATLQANNLEELIRKKLDELIRPYIKDTEFEKFQTMLDLITTGLTTPEEIKKYLVEVQKINISDTKTPASKNSGFLYLKQIFENSIQFYNERMEKKLTASKFKTRNIDDIINIFLTASGQMGEHRDLTKEACGILRIAAVFNLLERDGLASARNSAHIAINEILKNKLFTRMNDRGKSQGTVYNKQGLAGDNTEDISIHEHSMRIKDVFETVAKLLHKKDARPSDIHDHIGFRIVTNTAIDAFKLIRQLFFDKESVFQWSMIRAQHSEHKGLDGISLEVIEDPQRAKALFDELSQQELDNVQTQAPKRGVKSNKASIKGFKSINIVFDLPIKLEDATIIYFPIEAQIVSKQAQVNNRAYAPQETYKQARSRAVRKRISTNNLATEFEKTM